MADYFLGDLYPTMGHLTTRIGTIPEPADQTTLIDNQRQALENPIDVAPETSRGILWSVGIIFGVIFLLGSRF
jgi:hypothetical protein